MPTAEKSISLVSKAELLELAEAETDYAKQSKKLNEAKREVEQRRQALAEKILGISASDELKALSPEQIEKRIAKRLACGEWKLERGAPEFEFVKTSCGRYPAWAKLYAAEFGESAASKISAETPQTFSYRVEVRL